MKYLPMEGEPKQPDLRNIDRDKLAAIFIEEVARQTGLSPLEVATDPRMLEKHHIDYRLLDRKISNCPRVK